VTEADEADITGRDDDENEKQDFHGRARAPGHPSGKPGPETAWQDMPRGRSPRGWEAVPDSGER
jgi:hypothetical protein